MKKIFQGLLFGTVFLLTYTSTAQAAVFEFHFTYDQDKDFLNFDSQVGTSVVLNKEKNISIVEFNNPPAEGPFEYTLFDSTGVEVFSVQFTPVVGKFTLELPYFSIANLIKVRRAGEQEYFLEQSLKEFMTCNVNQICEIEKGENLDTCLGDCANGSTQYSEETERLLGENDGVITDKETGEVLLRKEVAMSSIPITSTSDTTTPIASTTTDQSQHKIIILIITVLTLVGVGIALYLWRRRRSA